MKIKVTLVALIAIITTSCSDAAVDACLDGGGIFNYKTCECDFNENHDYKEDHRC